MLTTTSTHHINTHMDDDDVDGQGPQKGDAHYSNIFDAESLQNAYNHAIQHGTHQH